VRGADRPRSVGLTHRPNGVQLAVDHVHGTHVTPGMSPRQVAAARRWALAATVMALLLVPYLVLNHYSPGGVWDGVVDALYLGIWSFFVVEAAAMLYLAPDSLAWARRNVLDVAIIAVTAPFAFLPDRFEVLQVLWLLRILDLLPVIHRRLFRITVLRFAVILWSLVVFGGGLAYAQLERGAPGGPQNLLDALYWANTVVSTVGFGDLLPTLWETKVLAMVLQLSGPVIAAILVAGILPLFDREFAEGFSTGMARRVEAIAGDVADIEADIEEIETGERAQDRVLAQIARGQEDLLKRLEALDEDRS
jgi:hypothetical protein